MKNPEIENQLIESGWALEGDGIYRKSGRVLHFCLEEYESFEDTLMNLFVESELDRMVVKPEEMEIVIEDLLQKHFDTEESQPNWRWLDSGQGFLIFDVLDNLDRLDSFIAQEERLIPFFLHQTAD